MPSSRGMHSIRLFCSVECVILIVMGLGKPGLSGSLYEDNVHSDPLPTLYTKLCLMIIIHKPKAGGAIQCHALRPI